MPKSVLIISTLDTKGQETLYLKDKLSAIGLAPIPVVHASPRSC